MSGWPTVAVILPTYNRGEVLVKTINLLAQNIHYSGKLKFFVGHAGNDNTPILLKHAVPQAEVLVPPVPALGNNLNFLLQEAVKETPIFMQMDDDHWLVEPLDIDGHVLTLMMEGEIAWIRLMGVARHGYTADLKDQYWVVHWDSEGPFALYIPSNRPHLKHAAFHQMYGLYPENLKLGPTEEGFCHQCKDISTIVSTPLKVAVPLEGNSERGWQHVGNSWQLQGK